RRFDALHAAPCAPRLSMSSSEEKPPVGPRQLTRVGRGAHNPARGGRHALSTLDVPLHDDRRRDPGLAARGRLAELPSASLGAGGGGGRRGGGGGGRARDLPVRAGQVGGSAVVAALAGADPRGEGLARAVPILPLRASVVFPLTAVPLLVERPASARVIDEVM